MTLKVSELAEEVVICRSLMTLRGREFRNLLTRRTEFRPRLYVLVARRGQAGPEAFCGGNNPACVMEPSPLKGYSYRNAAALLGPGQGTALGRHTFQSSRVTLSMAFAALCSQRSLRAARSRRTAGMALGCPGGCWRSPSPCIEQPLFVALLGRVWISCGSSPEPAADNPVIGEMHVGVEDAYSRSDQLAAEDLREWNSWPDPGRRRKLLCFAHICAPCHSPRARTRG